MDVIHESSEGISIRFPNNQMRFPQDLILSFISSLVGALGILPNNDQLIKQELRSKMLLLQVMIDELETVEAFRKAILGHWVSLLEQHAG